MKHRTGTSLNYLQYQGIINSIKTYMSKINIKLERKIESPFRPSHIKIFMQQKSGAQAMYNILNRNDEQPTGKKTWNEKFHFTDEEWKKIYSSPFCIIKYPAIQWFQISINHNILVTNKLLVKMKLKDNPYCYYCHSQEETITHLLYGRVTKYNNSLVSFPNG